MINRVLMIHYTPPGTVGGVEQIMQRHAALLEQRGIQVEIAAGRSSSLDLPIHVIPELDVAAAANAVIERELAAGVVSNRYHDARRSISDTLAPLVANADALIVHNAFTLHFSLPLTSVLWQLSGRRQARGSILAWTHDLAWVNPLYLPSMHIGYPWDLLRTPAPGVHYVTVSRERRDELKTLWCGYPARISIVPNGIDVQGLLRLSGRVADIADRYRLLERDLVLLLPVRITRRKNIETGIQTVRALKDRGLDVRLVVTGPAASHHPSRSRAYMDDLKALRSTLALESEVVFLADELGRPLTDDEISQLFGLSDCLFFPSESEGFGLPILEAGVLGVPVVLSDIPIFREVAAADALYFPLGAPANDIADTVLRAVDTPAARLRRRVRREYSWESILDSRIMPLLSGDASVSSEPHGGEACTPRH